MSQIPPILPFTGERFTPEVGGTIYMEHMHRYLATAPLARGRRVLDIACGEGYGSALLAETAVSVVGVDLDPASVAHATARYGRPGLSFLQGSCQAIPLPDASVDLVVSFETMEHHDGHEAFLREARRVMVPKGVFVLSCPDRLHYSDLPGFRNPFHVKELYRDEFEALILAHFARARFYGQKSVLASAILPAEPASGDPWSGFFRLGGRLARGQGLSSATYLVAVASDADVPALESGLMEDLDNLPTAPNTHEFGVQQARLARLEADLDGRTRELNRLVNTRAMFLARAWWRLKARLRAFAGSAARAGEAAAPGPAQPLDAVAAADSFVSRAWDPLPLDPDPGALPKVNIVLPHLRGGYIFGGYLTVLHLARALASRGRRVRLLVHREVALDMDSLAPVLEAAGLSGLLGAVEVKALAARDTRVPVSPRDRFIAFSHHCAHLAHAACRLTDEDRFAYLVQDFEPLFFPAGSGYAKALASYGLPQVRLFSSPTLKAFFARELAGPATESGPVFENAVSGVPPSLGRLKSRRRKKLVFYARFQGYAARNMADLGLEALRHAVEEGDLDPALWDFTGIGNEDPLPDLMLARGARLRFVPRLPLDRYRALLAGHDLGLSLMLSPHPSLPPFDMAAAGLAVVTNTFADKTAGALARVSPNLIAVEPTLAGLREGLRRGRDLAGDPEARLAGARLAWAANWEDAFGGLWPVLDTFLGGA